jgi:hypothetical protein
MPELPEAEVVAQQIRIHLLGAQLNDCWVGRADIVREGLPTLPWYCGARLEGVERQICRRGAWPDRPPSLSCDADETSTACACPHVVHGGP